MKFIIYFNFIELSWCKLYRFSVVLEIIDKYIKLADVEHRPWYRSYLFNQTHFYALHSSRIPLVCMSGVVSTSKKSS